MTPSPPRRRRSSTTWCARGRAFGVHVILASQTLAGAYALPRTTVDQMGVRIALQCSDADSRLILSDDNPAARLLERPGQAIYNTANGRSEGNNFFQVHADLLKLVTETFPHPSHWGRRRELPDMIDKITIEMNRRLAEADAGGAWPSIFLVVNGVQRAKDLRLEEMGYGGSYASFSSSLDEPAAPPPAPGQQFATILQQGPEVGIHVLAWCDTMTNLNRILERRSIREFEMRVAFQMSADDSANLIDTPAAAKLGPYRALLVSDEEARQEKFRPYRPPAAEWLAQLRIQLAGQAK
jgi:hypothetical protein